MKTYRHFVLVIVLSSIQILFSQTANNKSIAVLDLRGNGISSTEANTLTEELRTILVNSGAYKVIDRSNMKAILDEQGFQLGGCTSQECAVEAGRLLGVEKMVTGNIGRLGSLFTINLSFIDIETGQIIKSVKDRHKGSIEGLLDIIQITADKLIGKRDIKFPGKKVKNPPKLRNKKNVEKQVEPKGKSYKRFPDDGKFGLRIGMNLSTIKINRPSPSYRTGTNLGIQYQLPVFSSNYLLLESQYSQRGKSSNLDLDYLTLPIIIGQYIPFLSSQFFFTSVYTGIEYGVLLNAKAGTNIRDPKVFDNSNLYDNFDFGFIVGFNFGFLLGATTLSLDLRYYNGLYNIVKESFRESNIMEVKNEMISSSLTIYL